MLKLVSVEEKHAAIDSFLKRRSISESNWQRSNLKVIRCFRCNGNHYQSNLKVGSNLKCFLCGRIYRAEECKVNKKSKKGINKRIPYVFFTKRKYGFENFSEWSGSICIGIYWG